MVTKHTKATVEHLIPGSDNVYAGQVDSKSGGGLRIYVPCRIVDHWRTQCQRPSDLRFSRLTLAALVESLPHLADHFGIGIRRRSAGKRPAGICTMR